MGLYGNYSHEEYIKANKRRQHEWRLPTIDELMVMFNRTTGKATIEGFNSHNYWSSTTYIGYIGHNDYAWYVDFYTGHTTGNYKTSSLYVRCVKETDDGLVWSKSAINPMEWNEAIKYAKNLKD